MTATLNAVREQMPEYARDTKLNLSSVLTPEGAPGLSAKQIAGAALAAACATKVPAAVAAVQEHVSAVLSEPEINAARAAASIMAMNNVYYRFLYLANDPDYKTMPAKLRMTVIGNPGIDKTDFEVDALAVSIVNGCGMCVESHVHQLQKAGLTKEAVQSVARIAAVVSALGQSVFIMENSSPGI